MARIKEVQKLINAIESEGFDYAIMNYWTDTGMNLDIDILVRQYKEARAHIFHELKLEDE